MDALELLNQWRNGRARVGAGELEFDSRPPASGSLVAKFRRAYQWIVENAILTAHCDIAVGAPRRVARGECHLELRDEPGYSSFLLLPLLNLMTSRRVVFLGGPGRGKTTVATLMGLLAGYSLDDIRKSIQHGHPQLTIQDLLGSPLPSALMKAESAAAIRVDWRSWIRRRVKIIDEYNRIPTKTQSALLSLMAEGYAEMYEQTVESGRSAWYLTANDDLGGGTFPVIEALHDRIDLVVRCSPLHSQYLDLLGERIATAHGAEEFLPADIVFTPEELEETDHVVRAVNVPEAVYELLGFLLAQLDFCRRASDRLEFMNKDTLHLAGRRVGHVCNEDCPLDKQTHLCTQTENGVSPRAFQTVIHFAKALAWFRGQREVSPEDVRQILPWALFEKLRPNPQSAFFQKAENKTFLTDRVSWVQQLFDRAVQQHAAYKPVREPVLELQRRLASGATPVELRKGLKQVEQAAEKLLTQNELTGPVYEDLLRLKQLHSRLQQMLASPRAVSIDREPLA